jgi:uncharacterized protein RhaS with RHS repeats
VHQDRDAEYGVAESTGSCTASPWPRTARDVAVQYEYDGAGRLTHVHDSANGDKFYQYDPINRMTTVLDAKGHPFLVNTYGYLGEVTSQTLADKRRLLYEYGWDSNQRLTFLKFTDPQGYVIEWWRGPDGFTRSLPHLPN